MPLCRVCGKQNREQARFCGYCGRPLQDAPPQPAEQTRKAPQAPSSARWLRQVPGFSSGHRWKQIMAAAGYTFIALAIGAGAATNDVALLLLGVDALAVVLLATNAWNLRARVPLFNSPKRLKAASGWGILLVVGFGMLSVVVTTRSKASSKLSDIQRYYPQREDTVRWYVVKDTQTGQLVDHISFAIVGKTTLDNGRTVYLIENRYAQGVNTDYQEITSEQVLLHRLVQKDVPLNTLQDVRFTPPLPLLRSPLEAGRSWSESVRGGNVTLSVSYQVEARVTVSALGKEVQDCLRVVRTREGTVDYKTEYCPGIGIAAFEMLTAEGKWLRAELLAMTPAGPALKGGSYGTLLPPDDFLQAKVLEVGQALGWSLAYENRPEGLFIWRMKVKASGREQPSYECEGRFVWHLKRVGNGVGLHDPVVLPGCTRYQQLMPEVRRLQEDFKQRWLALVGPVSITGPTEATHSTEILTEALKRTLEK